MKMLVIGYGNELRQDDGVGPRVARIVAGWPEVEGIAVHQLTPELAERISQAERVVFVDAGQSLALRRLDAQPTASAQWGHVCEPQDLLALTESLYQRQAEAWLLEVPTVSFGFGAELSTLASRGLETAIEQIRHLQAPS